MNVLTRPYFGLAPSKRPVASAYLTALVDDVLRHVDKSFVGDGVRILHFVNGTLRRPAIIEPARKKLFADIMELFFAEKGARWYTGKLRLEVTGRWVTLDFC